MLARTLDAALSALRFIAEGEGLHLLLQCRLNVRWHPTLLVFRSGSSLFHYVIEIFSAARRSPLMRFLLGSGDVDGRCPVRGLFKFRISPS